MKTLKRLVLSVLVLLAGSWGIYTLVFKPAPVILAEARSMPVEADLSSIYGLESGPHGVTVIPEMTLETPDGPLTLTAFHPETAGSFPLLLFSHGNFSDRRSYDRIIQHWVSHGYVVLAPDHLDAGGMLNGILAMTRYGQDGVLKQRPRDLINVLEGLDALAAQSEQLDRRIDRSRVAATGHSFGAFTAQMLGGADAAEPEGGPRLRDRDARIQAVVAISPPGPMFDMIDEQSWKNMTIPQLVTTGTWDVEERFFRDWRLHAMSYERGAQGLNNLLVTEGADHYFGNLICRLQREAEPQQHALMVANAVSLAFLDAQLKGSQQAREFLESGTLRAVTEGFAQVSQR
ncbi:Alpha/beta hydrolase family protein [Microbulbifer aggregans]|uniref:Alpha/beta hydrolase family protein n=1 Tax=Microbulbifer aggregans TaxID=1769779 RepID=A0A1C9W3U8_9GAMM|nr:alpha/beta fold hydrolase [Microbulbifer aggregans]AOS95817.1 Alpha/beta hydrolase family protein [Microbulbifer aggregans]